MVLHGPLNEQVDALREVPFLVEHLVFLEGHAFQVVRQSLQLACGQGLEEAVGLELLHFEQDALLQDRLHHAREVRPANAGKDAGTLRVDRGSALHVLKECQLPELLAFCYFANLCIEEAEFKIHNISNIDKSLLKLLRDFNFGVFY